MSNEKQTARKATDQSNTSKGYKAKKKSSKNGILISFILLSLIFISLGTVYLLKDKNSNTPKVEETTTKKVVIKDFVGTNDTTFTAQLNKYFTYGTNLCIDGSLNTTISDTDKVSIVLKQAYTFEDGSINENDVFEFPLIITSISNNSTFTSYENINTGINLEQITTGEYCLLLKIVSGNRVTYGNISTSLDNEGLTYYSLTKDGKNNKIDLSLQAHDETNYIALNCTEATLPDDVYDIVLDPGHGGNDPGAVNGDYNEATLMLEYAKDIKTALEAKGYKVLLTRDGTESPDTWMAYTMYDPDGRVNVACASQSKIALSLHLNSNEIALTKGGIQTYFSCRANQAFAQTLVDSIVSSSNTYYSPMSAYKVDNGIYSRAFSEGDIAQSQSSAISDGFTPYEITPNTDYYFMIRELGGVATDAYVDGRNPEYGSNLYRDSKNGIEVCIVELGFISVSEDLNHILNNKDKYVEGIVNGILANINK